MREVSGYLTDDGAFYESVKDAEEHEATYALVGAYEQYVGKGGNIDRFRNVIRNLAPEIRRYLNAVEGPEDHTDTVSEVDQATVERDLLASRKAPSKVDKYTPDDGLGGTLEGVVEQSAGGSMHVPDVGDRAWAEEVRKRL